MKKLIQPIGLIFALFVNSSFASTKVDHAALVNADSSNEQWLTTGKNYQENRFSPLNQINRSNVKDLTLVNRTYLPEWRGIEATPILIDGTLYFTGPWSKVFAVDAKSGEIQWTYDPQVPKQTAINGCCDVVNRGVAAWDDKIYFGTFDGRLIALERKTGKLVWQKKTVDETKPYTITGAPRIVKGLVFIGNGGAELGVRGYFSAYDAQTGEMKWRFYTVPGNPKDGFENEAMQHAAKTWTGQWWKYGGGGTVWDSMAYDPELDLLYVGTGNGSPWDRNHRSPQGGDNLYLSSILALKPESGKLVWYYQTTPGDSWDFTATQHMILADLKIKNKVRKVLMQAPKNGYFYLLDRTNGELIRADAFTYMNWSTGIDMQTGKPIESDFARYQDVNAEIAPNYDGGHNWHPMSFDPELGYVFIPGRNTVSFYGRDLDWEFNKTGFGTGAGWNLAIGTRPDKPFIRDKKAPPRNGFLKAWNPLTGQAAWTVIQDEFWNGGVLATGGKLVFQGTADGYLKVYNSANGELLLSYQTGVGILAAPMSYQLDGRQYITVAAGWGGGYGMKNIHTDKLRSGQLLTFALKTVENQQENIVHKNNLVEFDRFSPASSPIQVNQQWQTDADKFQRGETLFYANCAVCHAVNEGRGGVAPNLRTSHMIKQQVLPMVLLNGALLSRGMPSFSGRLDQTEVTALSHFLESLQNNKRPSKQ
ncbi:PQQ-dependent dehydrogenase, methanol/ethanol family [Catenovulum agarivorans]|uniref:PQQ-dependent dehydrogenase, methanol/ethanol family n=1 Tax=Catenovulum agarivorans TaxID=1172192 RepID=UPI0002EC6F0C|nr:PQQ-dependent dehydrogenase, methanol/ethanol family [Catenovulum agarivorans]